MSVTHETAVRNSLADLVVDLLDVGSGQATGDLQFLTAADAAIATLLFANPAFGAAAVGVATANAIVTESNATAGVTTKGIIRDRDGTTILNFSVGVTGQDVNISSTTFALNDQVAITSLTYTAPV